LENSLIEIKISCLVLQLVYFLRVISIKPHSQSRLPFPGGKIPGNTVRDSAFGSVPGLFLTAFGKITKLRMLNYVEF